MRERIGAWLWVLFYDLQSIGLIPPIVYFGLIAKAARQAEDKQAIKKWIKKQIWQFLLMWLIITILLAVLQQFIKLP